MEKVKRFFRKLNEKKSYQIVVFAVSMCLILGGYFGIRTNLMLEEDRKYDEIESADFVKYVEMVRWQNNKLTIDGWSFLKGIDGNDTKIQVFLRNVEDKEDIIWLDTEKVIREDVDMYYDCEYDYSNVGFSARKRVRKETLCEKVYEILIKISYPMNASQSKTKKQLFAGRTVSTDRFLVDGKLSKVNHSVEGITKMVSDSLMEILNVAQLVVYREDIDIYIYQYEGELYWVAGERFVFDEEETTYLEVHLNTTRYDLLPVNRTMNGWNWDNLGFVFESCEIEENSQYRVAVSKIPTEYPVTNIWVGQYSDGWDWRESINLDVRTLK